MVATHLYVGFQYQTESGFVNVNPFFVIPNGTYNGKNYYEFYYTINGTYYYFVIKWELSGWQLVTVYPSSVLIAKIPVIYAEEQYPGIIDSVNWELSPALPINITEFYTYIEEEILPSNTVEACTYWYSDLSDDLVSNLPLIWQDKFWFIDSNGEGLFAGQIISNVTFDNGTPVFGGTGVYHIAAVLYSNSTYSAFSTTQSTIYSNFIGIIVMDSNNDYILPVNTEETYNQGTICLAYTIPPTEEEIQIECYKKAVWSKQCQYSALVDEYRQAMIFGSVCCDMLENLKQQRRILHILNCYDTRDIFNDTTLYNNLTYTQIQQLLTL